MALDTTKYIWEPTMKAIESLKKEQENKLSCKYCNSILHSFYAKECNKCGAPNYINTQSNKQCI